MKLRVKEICESKGMTQKELAEKTGLTEVAISKLSNPTKDTLVKIADALSVGIGDLFEKEEIPKKIVCKGELELGNTIIPCYVLEDGTRVLSGRGMQESLKMVDSEDGKQTAGTRLTRYLGQKSLKPFIISTKVLDHLNPIICYDGEKKIHGYEATVLADICEVFLEARKNIQLGERQKIIADQCEVLMRGFARVGIIALVDEATGYQYKREASELQKILSAYISPELMPWEKRFPDEFYREIFRLNNWGYLTVSGINIQNRPGCIGTWTKKYIYSVLPHGVLEALLERTERRDNGKLKHRLHQHLTKEQGIEHLNRQIISTVTLMNISDNWKEFDRLWNRKFGQQELSFEEQQDYISPQITK